MEGKLDILNLNKQEVDLIIKELKQMLTTLDIKILNTPVNLDDFPNTKNLYYTTESFLAYTNIK